MNKKLAHTIAITFLSLFAVTPAMAQLSCRPLFLSERLVLDEYQKVLIYSQTGKEQLTTAEYDSASESIFFRNQAGKIPLIVRLKWKTEERAAGWQFNQSQLKSAISFLMNVNSSKPNSSKQIVTATAPNGINFALKAQMINGEIHLRNARGETAVVLVEKYIIESQERSEKWSIDLFGLQEKINLLKDIQITNSLK
jgi:hypothetical protein